MPKNLSASPLDELLYKYGSATPIQDLLSKSAPGDPLLVLMSQKDLEMYGSEFRAELPNHPDAQKAFERLTKKGCDPNDLLGLLHTFCGSYITAEAVHNAEVAKEAALAGKRLLAQARKLQKFEARYPDVSFFDSLKTREFQGLSKKMMAYAERLISEAGRIKTFEVKDLGRLKSFFLAMWIEKQTGDPHYSDIARLMEVHYSIHGINKDMTGKEVARQFKGLIKKHFSRELLSDKYRKTVRRNAVLVKERMSSSS